MRFYERFYGFSTLRIMGKMYQSPSFSVKWIENQLERVQYT